MDNLASLKADIDSGLCTLISSFKKDGMSCRIITYNGLLFRLYFSKTGEILSCDAVDKNINFDQFVDVHGKDYEFTHMLFENTHHFIYVKPVDVRPWMRRSINIEIPVYWCIHRHFTHVNGALPPHFDDLAKRKDLIVNHYLREAEGQVSEYLKVSHQKLMAHTVDLGSLFIEPTARPC